MRDDTSHTTQHHLAAGQSLHIWRRSGSTFHIDEGRAYLTEPPEWLAERLVGEPQCLLSGGTHQLRRGGWVVVYAAFPVRLTVVTPRSLLWHSLRTLRALLRPGGDHVTKPWAGW